MKPIPEFLFIIYAIVTIMFLYNENEDKFNMFRTHVYDRNKGILRRYVYPIFWPFKILFLLGLLVVTVILILLDDFFPRVRK